MTNNKFDHIEKYQDGKYRIVSLENKDSHLRRIICDTESICIIPFDTNNGKIKNVYLAKYMDYLSGDQGHTCITSDILDTDDTMYERLEDMINKELHININVNDLYQLGTIKHNLPFSKTYKCYGVSLDNYSKDLNGFTLDTPESDNDKKIYKLDKVRFTRFLNGDIDDSLCLSGAMLLLSYIDQ
jgi:hypothetical protein